MRPRYFRPWFLIPCGRYLVALDEIQPVAAVFDRHGALVRTVDWIWSAPPQQALLYPRWACSAGASIWVDDDAASEVVRLDVDSVGQVSTDRASFFPKEQAERLHVYRLWRSHLDVAAESGTWQVRAELGDRGISFYTTITWQSAEAEHAGPVINIGYGAVVAATTLGDTLFAAVRRSGKRPFNPRPPVQLLQIDPDGAVTTVCAADGVDIAESCRPRSPLAPAPEQVTREWVHARLNGAVTKHPEAYDVAVTVRDWHTDPIGEISLRHPARPGLLLVWRNQLCTELGFVQPLERSATEDEEVHTESLPPPEWAHNGVLYM